MAERLLILDGRWLKIESQVEFLHRVWPELPARYQVHYNSILSVINGKLIQATTLLDSAIGEPSSEMDLAQVRKKDGKLRRFRFAFSIKGTLDGTIGELEKWQQNLLDPSWYQLVLLPSKTVSQLATQRSSIAQGPLETLRELRALVHEGESSSLEDSDVLLPSDAVELMESPIEFSGAQLGMLRSTHLTVLLDAIKMIHPSTVVQARADIQTLARRLSKVNAETFGFLDCQGAIYSYGNADLVFSFPKDQDFPFSLRHLLLAADPQFPLNARISIAQRIARSVLFLHSCQLVHKNVRPDNIVVFASQGQYPDKPYLIGLEHFRSVDVKSLRMSDNDPFHDIYRHPTRQGIRPERDYVMQHDIYSLGVCLLEIGLWRSFLATGDGANLRLADNGYVLQQHLDIKDPRRKAFEIKKHFVSITEQRLPGTMGQKYASIVVSCLTCLDPDNIDFGDATEVGHEDGMFIGVSYVEKVRCCQPEKGILLTIADSHATISHLCLSWA